MASIKDVARAAGVGVGTVSRVLNNSASVSPKTRERVRRVIREINYVPSALGRSLKTKEARMIGFLVPDISQAIFGQMAAHISEALMRRGYMLVTCNTRGIREQEHRFIEMAREGRMDALIIITANDLAEFVTPDIRAVALDARIGANVPCISSDNYGGAAQATELLIQKGCRSLAYAGKKLHVPSAVNDRYAAFCSVCERRGVKWDADLLYYNHGGEMKAAEKFLEKHPDVDGILAVSDYMAYCLIELLRRRGISVPEQVQVVGCDGVRIEEWYYARRLTTVAQDIPGIARRMTDAVMGRLSGELDQAAVEECVPMSLVLGDTTR